MVTVEFRKIYAVWYREIRRVLNSKARIFGSLGMPIFMLLALGKGIGALVPGFDYQSFILPGIIGQVILFNSLFSGVSIIWDRQFGFLKEMLVSPTKRTTIVIGRMLGGATTAVIQGMLVLILGFVFGIVPLLSLLNFVLLFITMFIVSSTFVGVGISIASVIEEVETFQLVMNFVVMPVFFLSNALFPIEKLPTWLHVVAQNNPLSYAVDAFRALILNSSEFNFVFNFSVCLGLWIVVTFIGTYLFKRAKV